MKIDSSKICEYLRVYSILLSLSLNNNQSLYENFKKMINENQTELSLDEYDNIILIKNYYSASMILFYRKDTTQKGLNDLDVINKDLFIDSSIPINKKCIENYTDKDIILYIRNAIAHNKNNLASINIDEKNLRIRVKLENTIASKGINKGKNIPFEVEFNNYDLLRMSAFCGIYSRTGNISGISFDESVVINSTTTNILKLLEDVIYTTCYSYTLFNTLNDNDKKKLATAYKIGNEKHNMEEFDKLKTKFVRKEEKIDLSDKQKDCLFNSIRDHIIESLELNALTPLTLSLTKTNAEIKRILGSFMQRYYEYEALKVIPLGREKHNIHIASILISSFNSKYKETILETIVTVLNSLKDKGVVYSFFETYNINDEEELRMFINNILDTSYLQLEAKSIYYNYFFENLIQEGENVLIGEKEYEADRIRNSFTHGRWYYDSEDNVWNLLDNKDSLKKADQYKFDWEASISDGDLYNFVNQRYKELIENKNKSI